MHFFAGVVVAVGCALAPWAAARVPTRWAAIAAAPFLLAMVLGAVIGLPLYPLSDLVVAIASLLAGIVLGRALPPRFLPLLVLLLALSVLDVAQNLAFAGPPAAPTPAAPTPAAPDPHLIWINFRIPVSGGHFNIGFADILLIAAVAENLRRRTARVALSVLPGLIGVGLGEALLATLPPNPPDFVVAASSSLVLFLTAGYVLTEPAVSQTAT